MAEDPSDHAQLEGEILDLLNELGVERRDLTAQPGERDRAERDLARIISSARHQGSPSVTNHRRRTLRAVGFFATAAAVAIGLVAIRPWTGDSPAMAATPAVLHLAKAGATLQGGSESAAPDAFRRLAAAAARQPLAGAGPVQRVLLDSWVLATDEQTGKAPPTSQLVPVTSERFFLPDGKFRMVEHRGAPLDSKGRLDDFSRSARERSSDSDETFGGPEEGPRYADRLSTNPGVLEKQLVPDPAECADILSSCLVSRITFLHYNYVLKPVAAEALWLLLAEQANFAYAGETHDRLSRPAVAFTTNASDDGRMLILLANPETGAFLGSEEVLVKDSVELGLKAPAVVEFDALVESARVTEASVPDPSLTTTY